MKFIKIFLIVFLFNTHYSFEALAATINAASCSQSDVQSAIDSAGDGDVVKVPSGECTWTTGTDNAPSVLISDKTIILQGAGIDITIIIDGTGSSGNQNPLHVINATNTRITGFTFKGMKKVSQAEPAIVMDSNNFHIDNCKFDATGSNPGRGLKVYSYGVIDHCIFINTAQGIAVFGREGDKGETDWLAPLTLGTANATYIEDCTFNYSSKYDGALDAYGGARYVFRYNTVIGTNIGHHGLDSGNYRSTHSYEIYNNTFTTSYSISRGATNRGGTGVYFNNTWSANYGSAIALIYYRSCCEVSHTSVL